MTTPAFEVRFVSQFTFVADDATLACIYNDIANVENPALSVNIRAYLELFLPEECTTLVKIVPGVSFGLTFGQVPEQTAFELATVRNVLRKYCVEFCETPVLFVSAASVPGQLRRIRAVLNAFGVRVVASYNDESTFSIYEVCNLQQAVDALTLSVEQQDAIIATTLRCDRAGNCRQERCKCRRCCERRRSDKRCDDKRRDDKRCDESRCDESRCDESRCDDKRRPKKK